jgi:hypothetical protein
VVNIVQRRQVFVGERLHVSRQRAFHALDTGQETIVSAFPTCVVLAR